MKKNKFFYLLFTFALTVICSCHHSSSNQNTTYGGTLSCNVNGIPFSATKCEANYGVDRYPFMNITGAVSNLTTSSVYNPIMHIRIYEYYGIDNYYIGPYPVYVVTTIYIDSSNSGLSSSYGTLTIDSVSPNIVGTFSFTASDSTRVTNGRFSVPAPK